MAGNTHARRWIDRASPYALPLLLTAGVGLMALSRVFERAGEPALPLDDSFIHLQYARRLAEGHFFEFTTGASYTSGATSFLWPALLAPWFWVGAGETAPIVATWLMGWLLHGAVALETARLAEPLSGRSAALAAGASAIVFGAFTWFAYSGMETMALAWVLVRGARVAAERWEGCRVWGAGPAPSDLELGALGLVAPLIRPEGVIVSVVAIVVVGAAWWRDRERGSEARRLLSLVVAAVGPAIVPFSHWLHTGQAVSATAAVKWLALDPYLDRQGVWDQILANAQLLVTDLLAGGDWTRIFVPEHTVWLIGGGALAMVVLGRQRRLNMRVALVTALLIGTLVPTSYATMLWNRVRYIWPFAPGWMVAIACFWAGIGELAARARPMFRIATPALAWGAVAFVAAKLDWATQDLATSARAIALQQVALGRWARANVPTDAAIGVNDTGAIAYYSQRQTFDVVGLTTRGEARYWAHGAGSRFEHYERLGVERLPEFFVVYPHWMAMHEVLGTELVEATVWDQSILGGHTMVAYEARWDRLGTGARPTRWSSEVAPLDVVDVADLDSEVAHDFDLGRLAPRTNVVETAILPDGREIVDGGRRGRTEDRFTLVASGPGRLILRLGGEGPFAVRVNGELVGEIDPGPGPAHPWRELSVALPASTEARRVSVSAVGAGAFSSWHYWLYGDVARASTLN